MRDYSFMIKAIQYNIAKLLCFYTSIYKAKSLESSLCAFKENCNCNTSMYNVPTHLIKIHIRRDI